MEPFSKCIITLRGRSVLGLAQKCNDAKVEIFFGTVGK